MIPKTSLVALADTLEGVPILGSLAGTSAERAGVRYGDVLLSVNGVRTRTLGDYLEAKALRDDGMTAVVFRDGFEHTVEISYPARPAAVDRVKLLADLVAMRLAPTDEPTSKKPGDWS